MNNASEVEILLVEDNATDAELTLRTLKRQQLSNKIDVVTDGEAALEYIFARGSYSQRDGSSMPLLILLDLKIPMVSGLEVLKTIKTNPLTRIIPVVILTSSAEESDILESYQLGANSYIVKPVDFDRFSEAVIAVGRYWLGLNKSPFKDSLRHADGI
jgi:two-component system response regulator